MDIIGVYATREALEYELPGWRPNGDDLILDVSCYVDTLYASEHPLHETEIAR